MPARWVCGGRLGDPPRSQSRRVRNPSRLVHLVQLSWGVVCVAVSSLDMGKLAARSGKLSAAFATKTDKGGQPVAAAPRVGPGAYDLGAFNLSRLDASRPSSGFASRMRRPSPFGGGPLCASIREDGAPRTKPPTNRPSSAPPARPTTPMRKPSPRAAASPPARARSPRR